MSVIVQKYGGSSVADVEKIGLVADRICTARDEGYGVVVVVSAMGKTTDELLALARRIDPTPPRRELDLLLSTGERVAMTLLSMALQRRGCDAISFTGSQSGILTNDWHFDAKILEVRPVRILDELARGRVVIVAGYQGMSYKREVTTLGRGGSDTTALAMAAALDARALAPTPLRGGGTSRGSAGVGERERPRAPHCAPGDARHGAVSLRGEPGRGHDRAPARDGPRAGLGSHARGPRGSARHLGGRGGRPREPGGRLRRGAARRPARPWPRRASVCWTWAWTLGRSGSPRW